MAPPSWKDCPHCRQKFSPSSLAIHEKRCRDHKEVKREQEAVREARFMKNAFWEREALPNWQPCPNCGERYAPTAMAPHVKRCRRLRPKGNSKGAAGSNGAGSDAFEGMWGVDDRPLPQQALEHMGNSLKQLFSGGNNEGEKSEEAPPIDEEAQKRLRALFDKFDANGDGTLSQREHGMLLFNCFPDRMLDAKALLDEFKTVDADGSGLVSFDEFVRYYGEMLLPQAHQNFDEAADMFAFFDADHSGQLEAHEFLQLLHNVFPTRCEENEAACSREFAVADTSGDGAISFGEFCAFYDRLLSLYGDTRPLTPDEIKMVPAPTAKLPPVPKPPPAAAKPPPTATKPPPAAAKAKAKGGKAGPPKGAAEAAPADDAANAARLKQMQELLDNGLVSHDEFEAKQAEILGARLAQIQELLDTGLVSHDEFEAKRAEILGPASESGGGGGGGGGDAPMPVSAPELVKCDGCAEHFLPHVLPRHQRSCAKARPAKKSVRFAEGGGGRTEGGGRAERAERPLPKPTDEAPAAYDITDSDAASIAHADNGSNTFVPCPKCSRSFFPDRLPIHMRACKGGKPKAGAAADADVELSA